MTNSTCARWCRNNKNLGILLLRIGVGGIFLFHGVQKLLNMDATINSFSSLGINSFWTWVAVLTEAIGGAAVLLGMWIQIAAVLLIIVMIVALYVTKVTDLIVLLLINNVVLLCTGAGKYSFTRKCRTCQVCDCVCHGGDERCGDNGKCLDCRCS